jgi:hypothetical protein
MTAEWFAGCERNAADEAVLPGIRRHVAGAPSGNVNVSARQGATPKRCQIRAIVACEIGVPSPGAPLLRARRRSSRRSASATTTVRTRAAMTNGPPQNPR